MLLEKIPHVIVEYEDDSVGKFDVQNKHEELFREDEEKLHQQKCMSMHYVF
jgi:hypothetical protein